MRPRLPVFGEHHKMTQNDHQIRAVFMKIAISIYEKLSEFESLKGLWMSVYVKIPDAQNRLQLMD